MHQINQFPLHSIPHRRCYWLYPLIDFICLEHQRNEIHTSGKKITHVFIGSFRWNNLSLWNIHRHLRVTSKWKFHSNPLPHRLLHHHLALPSHPCNSSRLPLRPFFSFSSYSLRVPHIARAFFLFSRRDVSPGARSTSFEIHFSLRISPLAAADSLSDEGERINSKTSGWGWEREVRERERWIRVDKRRHGKGIAAEVALGKIHRLPRVEGKMLGRYMEF